MSKKFRIGQTVRLTVGHDGLARDAVGIVRHIKPNRGSIGIEVTDPHWWDGHDLDGYAPGLKTGWWVYRDSLAIISEQYSWKKL